MKLLLRPSRNLKSLMRTRSDFIPICGSDFEEVRFRTCLKLAAGFHVRFEVAVLRERKMAVTRDKSCMCIGVFKKRIVFVFRLII